MDAAIPQKNRYSNSFWKIFIPGFAVSVVIISYIVASHIYYNTGFPLDDAWIHQTYARNLAQRGEWAFIPGQFSAGSTSPLWTVLLAVGYLISDNPYIWTFILGGICLWSLALIGQAWLEKYIKDWRVTIPWIALLIAGEWHLVWAAVSGMETIFFALIILLVFFLLAITSPKWWVIGLLIGLSAWVRPDGITLLGPALFVIWLPNPAYRRRVIESIKVLLGFLAIFLPYLAFNYSMSGNWWPNTFYAKQAEYAVMQQIPFLLRFLSIISLPLIGVGSLLLPGFIYLAWMSARSRTWPVIAAFLWWLGYNLIYSYRLPVTYQHGRYLIPSMPVYFVLGSIGGYCLIRKMLEEKFLIRILKRIWILVMAGVWIGFNVIGALAYAQDVAIIDTEMVATAKWLANNTPSNSLIAVHDIGAIGYFSNRKLVDLAGLVSPQVIPFIRDEKKLADYLDRQNIDYLVTFPTWYVELPKHGTVVFDTNGKYAPKLGGENMRVYQWDK